ncbi:MAG: beta-ketoacyl-ACP synthase III [Thermodesulfovibrionales bacterium]
MIRARIVGTGSYVPETILTNTDLQRMVDTSDEWIMERTGIRERRIADKAEAASDLAYEASKAALKSSGLKARDLDLIIVATVSGDMPLPSTACILQGLLNAKKAAAFDINAACSGFIYSLSVANAYIKSEMYKRVLVVGSEVLSKFTDWEDRATCILFGDGAGAAILEATAEERGILSTKIHSDGSMWELLQTPGGGSRKPASKETIRRRLHFIKMKGNETFKIAVRTLESLVTVALEENNLKPSQLSLLIPHQANLRIIQATTKRLKLPLERVAINLDRYGNTSAASVPIALDEAVKAGRITEGDHILLEAFGGGLTWASALIKW